VNDRKGREVEVLPRKIPSVKMCTRERASWRVRAFSFASLALVDDIVIPENAPRYRAKQNILVRAVFLFFAF
jgi:hypothetical protein